MRSCHLHSIHVSLLPCICCFVTATAAPSCSREKGYVNTDCMLVFDVLTIMAGQCQKNKASDLIVLFMLCSFIKGPLGPSTKILGTRLRIDILLDAAPQRTNTLATDSSIRYNTSVLINVLSVAFCRRPQRNEQNVIGWQRCKQLSECSNSVRLQKRHRLRKQHDRYAPIHISKLLWALALLWI